MKRRTSISIASLSAAAFLFAAAPSSAQSQSKIGHSTWRRGSGADKGKEPSPLSHIAFELRFGGYYPEVDKKFIGPNAPTPYHDIFGDGPEFYFGMELDWLPLRIPYVGAIGPGFGWGYTNPTGFAKLEGEDTYSQVENYLTIFPMHLSAVLRADELMRRTGVPFVPYGKFGLGLAKWSTGTDEVSVSLDGARGSGVTWGYHLALGGMLELTWLNPRSGVSMQETTGLSHVYLFGEWMNAMLHGMGSRPQLRVGSSSWVLGLAVER
jgi:hypothetical protein